MLTEKRQEEILALVNEQGSITVQELKEIFDASESTIRRDLNTLHDMGRLVKVFGGAVKLESKIQVTEERVEKKKEQNREEKQKIGQYAASLVEAEDFVYLDAGTTTGAMIPFLSESKATYVTNAVSHALMLAEKGFRVILIGGEMKAVTEAVVGFEACRNLEKYHFTKGFFGTNGVDKKAGYTTPDIAEASVKECAMKHSEVSYILCDGKKFQQICPVRFGAYNEGIIITDAILEDSYKNERNIIIV